MSLLGDIIGWAVAPWAMAHKYLWDRLRPKRPSAPNCMVASTFGRAATSAPASPA